MLQKDSKKCLYKLHALPLNRWRAVCETAAEKSCIFLFRGIRLAAFCFSQHLLMFCIHVFSYFHPFLGYSMRFRSGNYSDGGLRDRASPVTRHFWFGRSRLYSAGTGSLLHLVTPVSEKKCLAACTKFRVTLILKVNVQLDMTTTWNVLRQNDKTKKLTHCRFLLNQTFWLFLRVLERT
jgi:hypothetical protein